MKHRDWPVSWMETVAFNGDRWLSIIDDRALNGDGWLYYRRRSSQWRWMDLYYRRWSSQWIGNGALIPMATELLMDRRRSSHLNGNGALNRSATELSTNRHWRRSSQQFFFFFGRNELSDTTVSWVLKWARVTLMGLYIVVFSDEFFRC